MDPPDGSATERHDLTDSGRPRWLGDLDADLLVYLHASPGPVAPAMLAEALDRRLATVQRRCRVLVDHGLLVRRGAGFALSETGTRLVRGEVSPADLGARE